jgi:SHS2 domain-containing protein
MGTYQFLEHTADEKFVVTAKTLEDAFATAVTAFYEILLGKNISVKLTTTKTITLKTKKLESLLYDFLNELVFIMDESDLLLPIVKSLHIQQNENDEFQLKAELTGDNRYNYSLLTEIKNMTYSEMNIRLPNDEREEWELTIVVDI